MVGAGVSRWRNDLPLSLYSTGDFSLPSSDCLEPLLLPGGFSAPLTVNDGRAFSSFLRNGFRMMGIFDTIRCKSASSANIVKFVDSEPCAGKTM